MAGLWINNSRVAKACMESGLPIKSKLACECGHIAAPSYNGKRRQGCCRTPGK